METITIIQYQDAVHQKDFERLNLDWLNRFFWVEPLDAKVLSQPQDYIIEPGGKIFMVELDKTIIGCFALIKIDDTHFEFSKMAVADGTQGKGIGNKMMQFCLDYCKQSSIQKITIYSNTKLAPAIHLYKKYGFKEVEVDPRYERSDIKLILDL